MSENFMADSSGAVNNTEGPGQEAEPPRTSEKQVAANRRNAKQSTGPTSKSGKANSSQNGIKHGVFSTSLEPLRTGEFYEDEDEFAERVDGIVESLRPRDAIEREVATQIAGVQIKKGRLERWATATIESASTMTLADYETGLWPYEQVEHWEAIARGYSYFLAGMHQAPDYRGYATFIRYKGPDPQAEVEGLWTRDKEPSTDDEWRTAFLALKSHHWASDDAALAWAYQQQRQLSYRLEELNDYARKTAAARIMDGPFERQILYDTRLSNLLRTLMQEYERLQARDIVDGS